jgi:hypothetical protein
VARRTDGYVAQVLRDGGIVVSRQLAHAVRVLTVISLQRGAIGVGFISDKPDVDGLWSLAALDHVDGYPLAFG